MELIDVDRNGRLDIVASFGQNSDKLIWFRNQGGTPPAFAKQTVVVFPGWAMLLIDSGDLDGDGDTDFFAELAADECCDEEFVWIENTGSGFAKHLILPEFGGAGKILALDADGDEDLDLVRSDFLDEAVSWIENEGGGVFGKERQIDQAEVLFLRRGDVDGDGDLDIVTYDRNADELRWYETLGTGDFGVHSLGVFPDRGLDGLAVANFSSNGRADILIGNSASPLTRLENRGGSPPTFVEHTVEVARGASEPVVGDIDGDGRLDLIVTEVQCWSWLENRIGLRLAVTGLAVRTFSCRNRTTAQTVRVQTTDTAIDCENEGLIVNPGDEIEVVVRGAVE
jgi:hypothetical protein